MDRDIDSVEICTSEMLIHKNEKPQNLFSHLGNKWWEFPTQEQINDMFGKNASVIASPHSSEKLCFLVSLEYVG